MTQRIEHANKTFNQLTAAQKRVAIANDVLASIEKRKIRGVSGTWASLELKSAASEKLNNYWNAEAEETIVDDSQYTEKQLETILKEDTRVCHVCAVGGLFVCAVQRKNKITLNECNPTEWARNGGDVGLDGDVAMEYLEKFFPRAQLHLIELAFEGGDGGEYVDENNPKLDEQSAIAFGQRYANDTARLRALMQNIVDNEGTFTPPMLSASKMKMIRDEAKDNYYGY